MSSRTNMNRRRDRTNDDVDYEERPSRARTLALPILTLVGLACGIWFWQVNIGPEQSSTDSPATAGGELVAGEPIPNPAQYLRDLATRYGKLASYEEESSVEIRIPANGQMTSETLSMTIAFERPNRLQLAVQTGSRQLRIASDGTLLRTTVVDPSTNDFGGQYVERPAPQSLTTADLFAATEYVDVGLPGELLSLFMHLPINLQIHPVGLLWDASPWNTLLGEAKEIVELPVDEISGEACRRIRVSVEAGEFVIWVDESHGMIRRIEYPVAPMLPLDAPTDLRLQSAYVSQHRNVRIGQTYAETRWHLPLGAVNRKMQRFVLPFTQRIPTALKQRPDPFQFTALDGGQLSSDQWGGQPAVLIWFTDDEASQYVLQQVQDALQPYLEAKKIAGLAVCAVPTTSKSHQDIDNLRRRWQIALPLVRDLEAVGRDVFAIQEAPTLVILDASGGVQLVESGVNPELPEQLPAVIDKVMNGEDIADQYIQFVREQQAQYEGLLASGGAKLPAEPSSAADEQAVQFPTTVKLELLWKLGSIESPGNVTYLTQDTQHPQDLLLIHDGYRKILVCDLDGQTITQPELPGPPQMAVADLRVATDGRGRRFFLGFSPGAQTVHVFDDSWQLLLTYPDADREHAGIQDAVLADLNQDGDLELFVGFGGIVGIHAVRMDGVRIWSYRGETPVLSLATVSSRNERVLLATGESGKIQRIDASGTPLPPVTVGQRMIHHVFPSRSGVVRPTQLCGLVTATDGRLMAVGLTPTAKELWTYPLPLGTYTQPVRMVVSGHFFANSEWDWIFVGPDGSIHFVSDDGRQHDTFRVGSPVYGVASETSRDETRLIVSSSEGVAAYRVEPYPEDHLPAAE